MNRNKEFDIEMTRRALALAAKGVGNVSPGPLVGCVIVDTDGEIAGEGSYFFERVTHAEIGALKVAGDRAAGGTAYISLEPHVHHGKTPPCTKALIEAQIARVVVPIEDPNPLVSGKGFESLRENGIEVETGLLRREAEIQNEKFIHWHKNGSPFVHLKVASSLDGRIATRTGDSKWITGKESRQKAHQLRHEYDAILVGSGTVEADNPELTDRSGQERRKPLIRVVLDGRLRIEESSKIVATSAEIPTIIFTDKNSDSGRIAALNDRGIEVIQNDGGGNNLEAVLNELKAKDIQSVVVEGGAAVAGSFLDAGLVNKITFFIAPVVIGGEKAPCAVAGTGPAALADAFRMSEVTITHHGEDIELTGYPRSKTENP